MNASGDITFWVRLTDSREAIIATVPEASTPLLAGAALAVLAALGCVRRRVSVPAPRPLAVAVVAFVLGQASPAAALVVDRVVVGDPGNAADTTSHGAVATSFYIGTTEVRIQVSSVTSGKSLCRKRIARSGSSPAAR